MMNTQELPISTTKQSNMAFHVKSILAGLSLVLVIVVIYLATLPNHQLQRESNLGLIDEIRERARKQSDRQRQPEREEQFRQQMNNADTYQYPPQVNSGDPNYNLPKQDKFMEEIREGARKELERKRQREREEQYRQQMINADTNQYPPQVNSGDPNYNLPQTNIGDRNQYPPLVNSGDPNYNLPKPDKFMEEIREGARKQLEQKRQREREEQYRQQMNNADRNQYPPQVNNGDPNYYRPQINNGGTNNYPSQVNYGSKNKYQPQTNNGNRNQYRPQVSNGDTNQYDGSNYPPQVNNGGRNRYPSQATEGNTNQYPSQYQPNNGNMNGYRPQINDGDTNQYPPRLNNGDMNQQRQNTGIGNTNQYWPQPNNGGTSQYRPHTNYGDREQNPPYMSNGDTNRNRPQANNQETNPYGAQTNNNYRQQPNYIDTNNQYRPQMNNGEKQPYPVQSNNGGGNQYNPGYPGYEEEGTDQYDEQLEQIERQFEVEEADNKENPSIDPEEELRKILQKIHGPKEKLIVYDWDSALPVPELPPPCKPVQTMNNDSVTVCFHPLDEELNGLSGLGEDLNEDMEEELEEKLDVKESWESTMFRDIQLALSQNKSSGFIDIGAGIGLYSLVAASLNHSVLAIEPYMPNVRMFHRSVLMNDNDLKDKISLVCNVVSDSEELLKAELNPDNKADVKWNFIPFTDGELRDEDDENTVTSLLLDDMLHLMNFSSAVLKIEAPGHVARVLRSSMKVFEKIDITHVFMHWGMKHHEELNEVENFLVYRHYVPRLELEGEELQTLGMSGRREENIVWIKNPPTKKHG